MQIAARYRAVFELMQAIFADCQPADNIINAYFRERRFIGSGDRRFISDKIWDIVRHRRRLEFEAKSHDCRKMLAVYLPESALDEVFSGGQYGMEPLSEDEKTSIKSCSDLAYPLAVEAECPDWLYEKINDFELLKALNQPAGADFRVNRGLRENVLHQLQNEGFEVFATPYSPIGIRSANRVNLNNCIAYQDGLIEVQDEASQLAALLCDVRPNDKTIDYCCGAGGKSLAIAALLNGQGCIEAHDIDTRRLDQLTPRMQRLNINNIKTVYTPISGAVYQRFIIDAPCSGSGTWRRSPDAKFRMTENRLNEINLVQAEILQQAYTSVAVGGRIIYITCSVLPQENHEMVEVFVKQHSDLKFVDLSALWISKTHQPYPGKCKEWLYLNPLLTGTDGFFISIIEKIDD